MCLVIISVSYRQNAASHSIMRRDRQSLSRLMGRPPNRLGCRFCGRPGVLCASGHVDTPSVSVWILCTRLCALVPNRHGASQLLVAVGSGVANRLVGDTGARLTTRGLLRNAAERRSPPPRIPLGIPRESGPAPPPHLRCFGQQVWSPSRAPAQRSSVCAGPSALHIAGCPRSPSPQPSRRFTATASTDPRYFASSSLRT